ncbi:hypothetical protein HII31_04240 [Pseudocercospora fuligena]|uniref:Uncharacterized protein n=1 Tax=Pseudocercospora fuligena TaxID=685502 RepID=A0A8H6VPR0_9PEZI|nr:hypothetical protein HII31_04240 [Pseudocercospora fuligena]
MATYPADNKTIMYLQQLSEACSFACLDDATISTLDGLIRMATQVRNSKTQLLALPPEIRNRIWYLALVEDFRHQREHDHNRPNEDDPVPRNPFHIINTSARHRDALTQGLIPHSPRFIDSCRQIKVETESILYSEVMIWEEHNHISNKKDPGSGRDPLESGDRKILLPYQVHGLFNIRQLGLPILKVRRILDMQMNNHWTGVGIWQYGNKAFVSVSRERCGILRFAKETGLPATTWRLQPLIKKENSSTSVMDVEKWSDFFDKRKDVTVYMGSMAGF